MINSRDMLPLLVAVLLGMVIGSLIGIEATDDRYVRCHKLLAVTTDTSYVVESDKMCFKWLEIHNSIEK